MQETEAMQNMQETIDALKNDRNYLRDLNDNARKKLADIGVICQQSPAEWLRTLVKGVVEK